jgi:D-sedoheptulose 7-phosphate isomerase
MSRFGPPPTGRRHLAALTRPLADLHMQAGRLERWSEQLAEVLLAGGRLLAAGNGGSAAQAAHLTSELVGRYRDDRPPFSAIALCSESSALTAIGNDYGIEAVFARQVHGHGRAGDVLVALSTSGRSPNVLAAVGAAREIGMHTWAICGTARSPLVGACDDALTVDSPYTATIQEIHLIVVHLLCAGVEAAIANRRDGAAHAEVIR